MQVDEPVAVFSDSNSDVFAVLRHLPNALVSIEDGTGQGSGFGHRTARGHAGRIDTERAMSRLNRSSRPLLQLSAGPSASEIAFEEGPVHAADEIVHRHSERLPFDIPQREIERAEGVNLFP